MKFTEAVEELKKGKKIKILTANQSYLYFSRLSEKVDINLTLFNNWEVVEEAQLCKNCNHEIGSHGINISYFDNSGCIIKNCSCDWSRDVEKGTKPPKEWNWMDDDFSGDQFELLKVKKLKEKILEDAKIISRSGILECSMTEKEHTWIDAEELKEIIDKRFGF